MIAQRRILLIPLVASLVLLCMGCTDQGDARERIGADAEWGTLFDGETLDGWMNPYDWGEAWVEDGEIRLRADEKFFLVTEATYDDFELEVDVRVPDAEANSGIMVRAQVDSNRVIGYQAEVDPSDRRWSGGLYDEGRRGWLHPASDDSLSGERFRREVGHAFDRSGWNTYRIRCLGDSLDIFVNGVHTTAYVDTLDRSGYIGLQHHGEAGKVYRFRRVRLREL